MITSFIVLLIVFIIWIFVIFYYKEQKNIYGLNALLIIIIFVGPAIYYISGGTSYKAFSNDAIIKYHYLSSIVLTINIFFLILKYRIKIDKITKKLYPNAFNNITLLTKIYFTFLFLAGAIYIIMYFNKFPLIVFFKKSIIIERPDCTGDIPHFYTMSTIMMMIFPSVFFYIYNKSKNNILKISIFAIIILFMTIAGHKGIVVFFFIFIWFYIFKRKINIKLVSLFAISMIIYGIAKGRVDVTSDNLLYILKSSFSRMFVTQGAGLIERIHLITINYNFLDYVPIKNQVCTLVYHVKLNVCSMPTYFIGDIMVNYGYFIALIFYIILGFPFFIILKIVDVFYSQSVFLKWNIFMVCFLFSMAEISVYSLFRLLAIILNIIIVYYASQFLVIKRNNRIIFKHIK